MRFKKDFKCQDMLMKLVIINILFFVSAFAQRSFYKGDACKHSRKNVNGVCTIIDDCEDAINDLVDKDIEPQLCSFDVDKQIVCCPGKSAPKPPTDPVVTLTPKYGKSKQMCQEYAKYVYTTKNTVHVPGAPPQKINQCGFTSQPLIFGGQLATGKEFPHMTLIGYNTRQNIKWNCGGSLISDQWVMTAGHCLYDQTYGEPKFVRVGDLNYARNDDDAKPQDFDIIKTEKHPDYYVERYNDLALLKTDRKVEFTAYVRPACIWTQKEIRTETNNNKAIATGWGYVEAFGQQSENLLKVTLNLIPTTECNKSYKSDYRLTRGIQEEFQLCAGTGKDKDRKDACQGDSGGPLQVYADKDDAYCMYYIVGVTSFGKPCGLTRSPGVYTRVSKYISWIESIVWP